MKIADGEGLRKGFRGLKIGEIVPTGLPACELERVDNPTRKTSVAEPQKEPRTK